MQTWIYLAFLAFSAAFSASRFARLAEVCIGLALKLRCRNDRKNMTAKNHQGLHATERKEEKKKKNKAPREAVRVSHCRRGGRTTAFFYFFYFFYSTPVKSTGLVLRAWVLGIGGTWGTGGIGSWVGERGPTETAGKGFRESLT